MNYQIDFAPPMDNKQLRKEGAYLSASNTAIGCSLFMLIELLPPMLPDISSIFDVLGLVMPIIYLCMFSLPFSLTAGYALTWFLQNVQWYRYNNKKVILSGVLMAIIAVIVMLIASAYVGSCLISHGECGKDYNLWLEGLFRGTIFIKVLLIAAACGARTAWQLLRLAQQKTA